jgi:hypothetical protein
VNAAFLIVAAWAAGDAAPPTTAAAPAPAPAPVTSIAPAHGGSCCGGTASWDGGGCGCGCDDGKPSFFERMRARFRKSSCCDSCDTCCTATYSHAKTECCGCESSCECKPSFFERIRARFSKSSCCDSCDTCCDGGYGGYHGGAPGMTPGPAGGSMAPAGEPIKAPKESEPGKKLPTGGSKTQANPIGPDVTPAASRTLEADGRNPF